METRTQRRFFAGEGRKGGKAGEGGARSPREYPTFATFSIFAGPVGEKRRRKKPSAVAVQGKSRPATWHPHAYQRISGVK